MLDDKQYKWIERLKASVDKHWDELTAVEQKFMEDLIERFDRYGDRTKISPKQWDVITRISEKIL